MDILAYLSVIGALLALATVAHMFHKGTWKEKSHHYFTLYLFFAALYCIFEALRLFALEADGGDMALLWKIAAAATLLLLATQFLAFSMELTYGKVRWPPIWLGELAAFVLPVLMIKEMSYTAWGWEPVYDRIWLGLYGIACVSLALFSMICLGRAKKELGPESEDANMRMSLILVGFVIFVAIGLGTNFFFRFFSVDIPSLLGPLMFIPNIFIAYALCAKKEAKR
ncbi:MAG: hypothetical protein KAT70_05210 [Thermoplasmata archaeon]|nr:hypothetical protein [Thermoplasmata archaeon]